MLFLHVDLFDMFLVYVEKTTKTRHKMKKFI